MADRRTRFLVLRILGSIVMLAVLVPRIHLRGVLPHWTVENVSWLVAAVLATGGAFVLAAARWDAVLRAMGIPSRLPTLLHHYLAGLFVGNFLPSTIGGDILRVRRLAAENGEGAGTFASVVLERLTGWLVLPLLSLTALTLNAGLRHLGAASAVALAVDIVTLAGLTLLLVAVAHPGIGGRFAGTDGWRRFAGAIHLGLDRVRRHPGDVAAVLVSGVAYQAMVVLAAFLAARVLDIDHVGLTAVFAFFPAVAILQVLPITVGGLGVREWALVLFLHPLGVPDSRAVGLGLLVYGLTLAVSLLGAPSFAVGAPRRATT